MQYNKHIHVLKYKNNAIGSIFEGKGMVVIEYLSLCFESDRGFEAS